MIFLYLLAFNSLFFWRTLFYEYICDDFVVSEKSKGKEPKNIFLAIWHELTGQGFYNSIRCHVMTIFFHTAVCWLIYLVIGENPIALLTAFIFAILPANSECSVWISGKAYLYFAILVLSVSRIAQFLPREMLWLWPILGVCGVGCFLKLLHDKLKQNVGLSTKEGMSLNWRKVILFIKSYGYYFRIGICPYQLGFYHRIANGIGLTPKFTKEVYKIDRDFWWGSVILYIVITNILFNRSEPLIYGLIWFSIFILPFCNIITLGQGIALRYAYLAYVGLAYSLACILIQAPREYSFYVLGVYMVRLWFYMPAYRTEFWFNEYIIHEQPKFFRGWLFRGNKKFKAEDYSGALLDFVEATELCSHDCKSNFNVAMMYLIYGQIAFAEEYLKIAKENIFDNIEREKIEKSIAYVEDKIAQGKKGGRYNLEYLYAFK